MTEHEKGGSSETRRKRLFFRAQRRGFKEVDLIFGAFAEAHMASLSGTEMDHLEALMNAPDQDVYGWLRGHAEPPAEFQNSVFDRLRALCHREDPKWTV